MLHEETNVKQVGISHQELTARRISNLLRYCILTICLVFPISVIAEDNNVTLSVSATHADEHEESAVDVTATLDRTVDSNVEVRLDISGTATLNLDYEIESTTIEIPAETLSNSIEIIPIRDWDTELLERVRINIDSLSGAANLIAGEAVEIRFRDERSNDIRKRPIGANLFLTAALSYDDSKIEVETIIFNMGATRSSPTTLIATMSRNLTGLLLASPIHTTGIPALDVNGTFRSKFSIDLAGLETGFHRLLIAVDEIARDVTGKGGIYELIEGFEIGDDQKVIMRCRATNRHGVTGSTDPLFPHQWTLINEHNPDDEEPLSKAGNDLGMHEVIRAGEPTGEGVTVAVVDTGLETCHPDLIDSVEEGKSYNLFAVDGVPNQWQGAVTNDPYLPTISGDHGTSVSGIIAATADNGIGGRGVAPGVNLRAFNALAGFTVDSLQDVLGASNDAPSSSDVDVFNMSWGALQSGHANPTERDLAILKHGTENLRDGFGAVYVKAAGNAWELCNSIFHELMDDLGCLGSNVDSMQNTPYLITVGALSDTGERASYSSAGANLWVSAPAGDFDQEALPVYPMTITTDQSGTNRGYGSLIPEPLEELNPNGDYSTVFTGTSAAAPHVTGVVALLLQRNPDLTWRDVKHVLANSSRKHIRKYVH